MLAKNKWSKAIKCNDEIASYVVIQNQFSVRRIIIYSWQILFQSFV